MVKLLEIQEQRMEWFDIQSWYCSGPVDGQVVRVRSSRAELLELQIPLQLVSQQKWKHYSSFDSRIELELCSAADAQLTVLRFIVKCIVLTSSPSLYCNSVIVKFVGSLWRNMSESFSPNASGNCFILNLSRIEEFGGVWVIADFQKLKRMLTRLVKPLWGRKMRKKKKTMVMAKNHIS